MAINDVVLLPEREFSEFKNWKSGRGVGGGIVQAVRNPEQREMVKKFHAAQEIFNDSNIRTTTTNSLSATWGKRDY